MKELVINSTYGGFSLSRKAFLRLRELGHPMALEEPDCGEAFEDGEIRDCSEVDADFFLSSIPRDDKLLIQVVKELGEEANGSTAKLKIVKIPDDADYEICEYDGIEWVVYVDKKTCTLKEVH